ncbi:hypothetical protein EN838_34990, partial [Mesorhizobium sp. M1C.F.Ca.ET.195.01.1.1]
TQDPDEAAPATYGAVNSWWNDDPSSSSGQSRLRNMAKYFQPPPIDAPALPAGNGPNYSCTTNPITPLTDVRVADGLTSIKAAIALIQPNAAPNLPEAL